MKVETPQLRWHQIINPQSQKDAGANGPILSCSLLSSSTNSDNGNSSSEHSKMGVLATAGNTEVNLWRVRFTEDEARSSNAAAVAKDDNDGQQPQQRSSSSHILVQPQTSNNRNNGNSSKNTPSQQQQQQEKLQNQLNEHTLIEHIVTLSRGTNERGINAVKFSPCGRHLVAAGDGGTVVMWSAPPALGGSSYSSFWSTMEKETDATLKILFNQSDDVMDIAFSSDSKRFAVCSLDHTMTVWEDQGEQWRTVHRSTKDHTHYIQGVAYDPQGVYLASMGSDRMVKVYSRKGCKEGAIKGELNKYVVERTEGEDADGGNREDDKKAILQSKVLPELLTNSTFALQNKIKTMKFLSAKPTASEEAKRDNDDGEASARSASPVPGNTTAPAGKRHHMFADELTLGSFFRRLAFTTDGAFLVVPAALWHGRSSNDKSANSGTIAKDVPGSPTSVMNSEDRLAESSFATYLFARHRYDQPYKVLTGLEKPSVVVRPNPMLFQLPPNSTSKPLLPYRSVFAVLTTDTVLFYDTHHDHPLAMARGLHYAGLTDATWSSDGRTLFVTSSDGYVSILSFGMGELGEVYVPPVVKVVEKVEEKVGNASDAASKVDEKDGAAKESELKNGVTIHTLVPKKKAKTVAPVESAPANSDDGGEKKVTFATPADDRSIPSTSTQPIINTLVPKKKKKKIAPTLVTTAISAQQEQPMDGKMSVDTTTMEKKRTADEETSSAPTTETTSQAASINILVPKKKKKVASSNNPVPTM